MKRLRCIPAFACLLLLAFPYALHPQRQDAALLISVDSLKKIYSATKQPARRADLLNQVAWKFFHLSKDSSLRYLELAEKVNADSVPRILYTTHLQRGEVYENLKDYGSALNYYRKTLRQAHRLGNSSYLHECYTRLMNLYFYEGNYFAAASTCLAGLSLTDTVKDEKRRANYYNLLGFIYASQHEDSLSNFYYRKYFQLAGKLGDRRIEAHACQTLAEALCIEKKCDSALLLLNRTFAYQQSVKDYNAIAFVYYLRSRVWEAKGNADSALFYMRLAYDLAEANTPNKYDHVAYLLHFGKLQLAGGKAAAALAHFRRALSLARSIHHKENIRDAFYSLFLAFEKNGKQDSALYYFRQYAAVKDSVLNERTHMQISSLIEQYNYTTLQKELKLLSEKNALISENASKERSFRNSMIVAGILIMIVFFLVLNGFHLRRNARLQSEVNQRQNELFNTVISVQDNERRRIAGDLHDSLGSVLSAAKLGLERMEEEKLELTQQQREKYAHAIHLLDEAISELRSISHNLMPPALSKLGLIAALRSFLEKITEYSGIQVHFSTHNIPSQLSEQVEITLYRVVLELVNNTVKHAEAGEVTLQLVGYADYINLTFEDNGKGFDALQAMKISGLGLKNIFSRIDLMKGKADIDSEPGRGTIVNIDLPLR